MHFGKIKKDVDRIKVKSVEISEELKEASVKYQDCYDKDLKKYIRDNEKYDLSFFDTDGKLVHEENEVKLSYIDYNFGSFLKYRIDELRLCYGETKEISNLSYDRNVDFRNRDDVSELLKQLFISRKYIDFNKPHFVLNDGTIIQITEDVFDVLMSISNKQNDEFRVEDVLSSGSVYIFRNTIVVASEIDVKQKEILKPWLSRCSYGLNFSYYKNGEFRKEHFNYSKNFENFYSFVNSIYTDDKDYNNLFQYCSLESALYSNPFGQPKHVEVFKPDFRNKSYVLEAVKYQKKKIYKELDLIVEVLMSDFEENGDDLESISKKYAYKYEFDEKSKKFKPVFDYASEHITKDEIECGWHPIVIDFIHDGKNSYEMFTSRMIENNSRKKKLSNEEFIRYSTDNVYLTINLDRFETFAEMSRSLQHEFVHVVQRWGKIDIDEAQTVYGKFGNIDVEQFYNDKIQAPKDVVIAIQQVCYMFDQSECSAVINELRRYILDNISKDTILKTKYNSLINSVYDNSKDVILFLKNMGEIVYAYSPSFMTFKHMKNVINLLMLAHFLNKHKQIHLYRPIINAKYITRLINNEISFDDVNIKEVEEIRHKVYRYLKYIHDEFDADYKDCIYSTIEEIKNN